MYENHYQLRENPFQLAPNPAYFFMSSRHENALAYLRYGIMQKLGFNLLTGEIGTGKTTVVLYFLKNFCSEMQTAFVSNTHVPTDEFLVSILSQFGVSTESNKKSEILELLNRFLVDNYSQQKRSLLVIDEAQNLSRESLEDVRMLSNIQHNGDLLLPIILAGQPELRARLKSKELYQLSQRISASYHLTALTEKETSKYIAHRLKMAGAKYFLFKPKAVDMIYQTSVGIPRTINILCDASLVHGFAEEMKVVTADAVKDALDDKDGLGIEFDTEYANSVLSAPAAVPELDSDVIQRLETLEKEISELKGQMELQDKKLRQRLNSFKKNLQKGLAKVVRQERKRTDNIIKGFIRYVSRYDLLRTGKADDDQSWKSIPLNKNEENEELDSADIV